MWETIKTTLARFGRPLLAKWITRAVLWGATAVSAKAAISAPSADVAAQVADWLAAVLLAVAAGGIDFLHDRADKRT